MKSYSNKGKLGVCIELKNNNYGSMLQSYATQVMLSNYQFDYDLINYKKVYDLKFILKSIPRVFNNVTWQDKFAENEKKQFIKKHPEVQNSVKLRKKAFEDFRKQYFLANNPTYVGYDNLKKESEKYSAFLTGSDQLWSPSGLATNFYNLMFAREDSTKISYASSFGVKMIPWYQKNRTKKYLNRIQYISCREKSGTEIVKYLTDRNVPVVADPTMLFTAEEWDKNLPCKRVQEGEYIFSYILGTNFDYRKQVEKLSKDTNLPIVSIHQFVDADLNFGDVVVEDAGPAEFVDLIKNAKYVCTDSFHGSVFSIINHKNFIVFNRYSDTSKASKNTRIDNLCGNLGLQNRRFKGNITQEIQQEIDYDTVDSKLEKIRKSSYEYLENAFDSIKF